MSEIIKSECKNCKRTTNHNVLHKHTWDSRGEDPNEYHFGVEHLMVKCLGCENIAFRKEVHDYETYHQVSEDDWEYDIQTDIYPHFIRKHDTVNRAWVIPQIVESIYKESILAIQEEAFTLAGLGLRATIEAICNEQDIKGKDLQKRINAMVREGLISKKDAQRLHSIRFMGNDAAHEIKKAKKASVLIALKIVEHLLATVYILDTDVKTHLETTITTFDNFIKTLKENMKLFDNGETITLVKWLGKDKRRIVENYQTFENDLITYCNEGKFSNIEVIDITSEAQTSTSYGFKITIIEEISEEDDDE